MKLITFITLIVFQILQFPQAGYLDYSFGYGGFKISEPGFINKGVSTVVLSDAKILVAASYMINGDDYAVLKYNPDGYIDNTFGIEGIASFDISEPDIASDIALQQDEKIILAGTSNNDFCLIRMNADGSLDNTFSGDGVLTIPIGSGVDSLSSIAIQSDGKIICGGYSSNGSNTDFAIVRVTSLGILDDTFDSDGIVTFNFNNGNDNCLDVIVQNDGNILGAGYSYSGATKVLTLVRIASTGALDGIISTQVGTGHSYAQSIVLQNDQKIVVCGTSILNSYNVFTTLRYNANGTLDTSFDGDGIVQTQISSNDAWATAVNIQSDEKIVVCGYSMNNQEDLTAIRLNSNGSLDNNFGAGGKTVIGYRFISSHDYFFSSDIQPDGKILLVGQTYGGPISLASSRIFLARINSEDNIAISEIYNGAGSIGAYFKNDYITLYNPTASAVDLSGWSIQYSSATSSEWSSNITNLTGSILPNSYFFILQAAGLGDNNVATTADITGNISISSTGGKVALVKNQIAIIGITDPDVIDFVGYGTSANEFEGNGRANAPDSISSLRRKDNLGSNTSGLVNGSGWDSNNNSADFYIETSLEHNPALPIELNSFTAKQIDKDVRLEWQTATEVNNYGFEVERLSPSPTSSIREGAYDWEKIGFVTGSGNSNSEKSYSFEDHNLTFNNNLTLKYRLKQIDNDGVFNYSKVIEVEIQNAPEEFSLEQNYPNPFNPSTKIKYSVPFGTNRDASLQMVTLKVYDILGNEVATLVNEAKAPGYYEVEFSATNKESQISSGVYIYRISSASFTASKKLVLMK